MLPFWGGKATREAMPGEDGSDDERNELERKHTGLIYKALQKLMRKVAPTGTTVDNITPDDAVRRYRENESILRDALVAMLTDGALLGADVGRAQTEWLMGVRKAVTVVGVDWDLINEDVLSWVMGGGAMGGGFGDGYANAVTAAMATTSERQLRTLIGEWIRNDLTYRQLTDTLTQTVFSRTRAEMASQTEITRAYAEGNRAAWRRGGIIKQMRWYTAADERRCPICEAAHGQISDVNGDFGSGLFPPAHPRCRCFIQPYVPTSSRIEPVAPPAPQPSTQDVRQAVPLSSEPTAEEARQKLAGVEKKYAKRIQKAEELRVKYESSNGELSRLMRREDEILAEYYNATPERQKELDKESRAIRKELKALRKLRDTYDPVSIKSVYDDRSATARQHVHVNNPAENTLRRDSSRITDEMAQHFQNGLDEFNKLVGNNVWGNNDVGFLNIERGREFYNPNARSVVVTPSTKTSVIVHEIGHALEHQSGLYLKVKEFYDKRTAGDSLESLRSITGKEFFDNNEMTRRDKWVNPYVGKDISGFTEVVSMGLQYMYEDPVKFAKEDPDMFDFIFDLVRGRDTSRYGVR